ncbi:MAG TPA: hypothetical protein PLI60_03730 [Anaerolineaceae bacterium]|nr:hypothetical protein [Anaerolineaceae bacterium]HQN03954.1 hypothetical protein [Anaerolineaceae bacterium]HQP08810.1 hypothetical protein [Anaerolineaceae bacterium]
MLDDLRNSAASSYEETIPPEVDTRHAKKKRARGPFLGMTSAQRFVVVLMLFILVIILGTLCLLLTGRVVPF